MLILMIAENDPAGMGIAFANAINSYTEHHCRLITKSTKYNFDFEKDLHLPDLDEGGFEEIIELLKKADIIHFHILADEKIQIGPIKVKDYVKGKALLHHHHGHPDFRANPEKYRSKYSQLSRKALVSTPDLLTLLPEATWQPNLVPINSPQYLPNGDAVNGKVRVCHSPTRKDLKNTREFNNAIDHLKNENPTIEKVLIENTPHMECLMEKQICDIHFDHMQGYFGVASLEGLSQGKVVIGGLDEWNKRCIQKFTCREKLPWVIARNQDELEGRVEELVADSTLRRHIGEQSRRYMEDSWSEESVLKPLMKTYAIM